MSVLEMVPSPNGTSVEAPVLELRHIIKRYPLGNGAFRRSKGFIEAVGGVSLRIERGQTLGLVGESGSGKSTIARLATRLIAPTSGTVMVRGEDVTTMAGNELRRRRRHVQMVFQDPYSSFDPYASVLESVGEPLHTHFGMGAKDRLRRAGELLDLVGLSRAYLERYPSELSGGQLQRAAIARALAVDPELLVLDEPVSALDVSTQAQVINLLQDLQRELGVSYLFIAHDLSVVRHVSHRIAVMYLGRLVEEGPAEAVYTAPAHPYSTALLSAVPVPDPATQRARRRITLEGDIPSPADPPTGCRFHTRCPFAMSRCAEVDPPAFATPSGAKAGCLLHTEGPQLRGASIRQLVEQGAGPRLNAEPATTWLDTRGTRPGLPGLPLVPRRTP